MVTDTCATLRPAIVCRWAGAMFLAAPDAAALALYREADGAALLADLAADLALAPPAATLGALSAPGADIAAGAERLAVAHSAAFLVGARHAPAPYASVWLSPRGTLFQEPARAMARLLAEAGLELEDGVREPPDHLGLQLNFLAELLNRDAAGRPLPVVPQDFAADHVLSWLPRFASACEGLPNQFFYPALARGLLAYLKREMKP